VFGHSLRKFVINLLDILSIVFIGQASTLSRPFLSGSANEYSPSISTFMVKGTHHFEGQSE
jgi:hypothetical protein